MSSRSIKSFSGSRWGHSLCTRACSALSEHLTKSRHLRSTSIGACRTTKTSRDLLLQSFVLRRTRRPIQTSIIAIDPTISNKTIFLSYFSITTRTTIIFFITGEERFDFIKSWRYLTLHFANTRSGSLYNSFLNSIFTLDIVNILLDIVGSTIFSIILFYFLLSSCSLFGQFTKLTSKEFQCSIHNTEQSFSGDDATNTRDSFI